MTKKALRFVDVVALLISTCVLMISFQNCGKGVLTGDTKAAQNSSVNGVAEVDIENLPVDPGSNDTGSGNCPGGPCPVELECFRYFKSAEAWSDPVNFAIVARPLFKDGLGNYKIYKAQADHLELQDVNGGVETISPSNQFEQYSTFLVNVSEMQGKNSFVTFLGLGFPEGGLKLRLCVPPEGQ